MTQILNFKHFGKKRKRKRKKVEGILYINTNILKGEPKIGSTVISEVGPTTFSFSFGLWVPSSPPFRFRPPRWIPLFSASGSFLSAFSVPSSPPFSVSGSLLNFFKLLISLFPPLDLCVASYISAGTVLSPYLSSPCFRLWVPCAEASPSSFLANSIFA